MSETIGDAVDVAFPLCCSTASFSSKGVNFSGIGDIGIVVSVIFNQG